MGKSVTSAWFSLKIDRKILHVSLIRYWTSYNYRLSTSTGPVIGLIMSSGVELRVNKLY